jgi:hypothetical protein
VRLAVALLVVGCSAPAPDVREATVDRSAKPVVSIPVPSASESAIVAAPVEPWPGPNVKFVPIQKSRMLDRLKTLGIDSKAAPELASLPLEKKTKVMEIFVESLGLPGCEGCHVAGDKKAPTRRKAIALRMWSEFVAKLETSAGDPIFCDSCHAGRTKLFDRSSPEQASAFMTSEYVGRLARADHKDHGCQSCHGRDLVLEIFDRTWKVPAPAR